MRQTRTAQATIYEVFSDHELGRELQTMSEWLDANRGVLTAVMNDLCRRGLKPTGRCGLSAESVLRCALLKQHRQLSYEELAFYLRDSASFQAFARLPMHWCPKKSALQQCHCCDRTTDLGAHQSCVDEDGGGDAHQAGAAHTD